MLPTLLLLLATALPALADTTSISPGQTLSGTLGADEQDVFTYAPATDEEVFVRLTRVSGELGTTAVLRRVGGGNQGVGGNDGVVLTLEQVPLQAGQSYEVLVPALVTAPSYGGQTYRVYMQSVTAPVGATAVAPGGGATGALAQPGEVDFYTVAVADGDVLRVDVSRTSGAIDPSAVFYIPGFGSCTPTSPLDDDDNPATSTECGDFTGAGTFAFAIEDLNDAATDLVDPIETGGYAFTVTCVAGPCLTTTTTTTLPVASTTTSTTTPGGASTTTTTLATTLVDRPVAGTKLLLRDKAGKPRKRTLSLRADDAALALSEDPRTAGATLRLRSVAGAFDVTLPLPGAAWATIGKATGKGFRYADAKRASGPVTRVRWKPGSLRLSAKGDALPHDLATNPVPVDVVFTVGGTRWCATFGGTVRHRAGTKLVATNASATVCP